MGLAAWEELREDGEGWSGLGGVVMVSSNGGDGEGGGTAAGVVTAGAGAEGCFRFKAGRGRGDRRIRSEGTRAVRFGQHALKAVALVTT